MDNDEKYVVRVNDFNFVISRQDAASADIVQKSADTFHCIKDHQSFIATIHTPDNYGKKLRIEIAGEMFEVEIKEPLDQLLEKMGYNKTSGKQVKQIKAPMPGLVLQVSVAEGQEMKGGERLLILEAMKMENSINIHAEGKIKKILVKNGQAVDKGQVLIELE